MVCGSRVGLNHHDHDDCWELPFSCSFSLKDHVLTNQYLMQYRFPLYTSLQLVLLLCVNNIIAITTLRGVVMKAVLLVGSGIHRYRTFVLQRIPQISD